MSLITILREVPDPRTGNAKLHNLLDLLMIAITASVCGCNSCVDFADFAEDRQELLEEFLDLPNGLPSHDTFSRLFRLLEPAALALCFSAFLDQLGEAGEGVIAIDGKTLRRSFNTAAQKNALHVVSAFASEAGVVLGQVGVEDGENEITAARRLLKLVDIKGALVTGDAMHCQSETAALIRERGGEWLFSLKKNRPSVFAAVETFFDDPASSGLQSWQTTDADHGRIEVRDHDVCHDTAWIWPGPHDKESPAIPNTAMIGRVRSRVEKNGVISQSTRYYLSSKPLSAPAFAAAVRSHWAIESRLHWVLDMTFDEDRARNRTDHGPENLTIIRKLALNLLKKSRPELSIARKRKRAGWSDNFAKTILGQMR